MMKLSAIGRAAPAILSLCLVASVHAQWLTQRISVRPGWSAVYLHVDPSHQTVAQSVAGSPITEVWLWKPVASHPQFADSPNAAVDTGSDWLVWKQGNNIASSLSRLIGNAGYLIYNSGNVTVEWQVKGQTVPPFYNWSVTGENLIGFPSRFDGSATPAAGAPTFGTFLSHAPAFQQSAKIFGYQGGNTSSDVFSISPNGNIPVRRGEAFWIAATNIYNRYFSAFEVTLQNPRGIFFGDSISQYTVRLKNLTVVPITVHMRELHSDTPPVGQPAIAGPPRVIVRTDLIATNLVYGTTNLEAGSLSWKLAAKGTAGSAVDVVLGLDRSLLKGDPGENFASILRFWDSLHFSEIDVPVTARKASRAGLWIGNATISQVRHELAGATNAAATALNQTMGAVPQQLSLRLIIHVDTNGTARLLQKVYYGLDSQLAPILATTEAPLHRDHLSLARRISAVHLPWTTQNTPWAFGGTFDDGQTITNSVALSFGDHASNPFIHTYHPDHDNFNALFNASLTQGEESYSIVRNISMELHAPNSGFASLSQANRSLSGVYGETISLRGKGSETRQYAIGGTFSLKRVSTIGHLVTP